MIVLINKMGNTENEKKMGWKSSVLFLEIIYLRGPLHLQGAREWAIVYRSLKPEAGERVHS